MGSLLAKFRREKTSLELLEHLQDEIDTIECDRQTTLIKQKKIVGKLILYSVFVYFLLALGFYFLAFPSTFRDGALYIAPLVLIPIIIFLAQRFLKWYFAREISQSSKKLSELRATKKKILEKVMDKETFRKAKEILEKYAPDQLRKSEEKNLVKPDILLMHKDDSKNESLIKRENIVKKDNVSMSESPVRKESVTKLTTEQMTPAFPVERPRPYPGHTMPAISQLQPELSFSPPTSSQKRRLIRPILDPVGSRGIVDRLIEHLVGDGPANRYALICSHCSSHNGMALKEEFEYISFRCAYCGFPNPSRKVMTRKASTDNREQTTTDPAAESDDKNEETSEAENAPESASDETGLASEKEQQAAKEMITSGKID